MFSVNEDNNLYKFRYISNKSIFLMYINRLIHINYRNIYNISYILNIFTLLTQIRLFPSSELLI